MCVPCSFNSILNFQHWGHFNFSPYLNKTVSEYLGIITFSSVYENCHVGLFVTQWTAAHQASLSITNSQSLPKLMSIESWWCHPTISSSVIPFSSRLQSFPASGSFQINQFFASGGQNIEVSASTSVLPMNIQHWFPLGWTGWISLQSKGLSRVFSNTTVQKHQFFSARLYLWSNSHIHAWLLEKPYLWLMDLCWQSSFCFLICFLG